jgi:hypothetical protein
MAKKNGTAPTDTLLETAHKIGARNTHFQKRTLLGRRDTSEDGNNDTAENDEFKSESVDEKGNQSLNIFLRKTSLLCEGLLDESAQMKMENKQDRNPLSKSGNIFNSSIVVLGGAQSVSEGKEQDVVRLRFYHLLLSFVGNVISCSCFCFCRSSPSIYLI